MRPFFDWQNPKTLKEACNLLEEERGEVKVIAGGTDLMINLRKGHLRPRCLVDITGIEDLHGIKEEDGKISIGAAVTHAEVASSLLVQGYGRVLSDAARMIGSPQIRNLGTIGGNIINASPAADAVPPLMVLDAVAEVTSYAGERKIPLVQLFSGPYETSLKPHELLVRITFQKLPSGVRTSFVRLARRERMAIARMSVAIVLQLDRQRNGIEDIRVSIGAMTATPHRLSEAEMFLKEKSPDEHLLRQASQMVSQAIVRWSGLRASTGYKVPVVESLFLRAVRKALREEK
jgi:nicotinate dehydrogenase FAD-subunit